MKRIYNREKALEYAHKWVFSRNPNFYNFDNIGGDCTNFVSQCLYAGGMPMNYTKDKGWYYVSSKDRAAAWTGVEYLYKFLTTNKCTGPRAVIKPIKEAQIGDIIQISYDGERFGHSLFVVSTSPLLVNHHSDVDAQNRPFSSYVYNKARLLAIE